MYKERNEYGKFTNMLPRYQEYNQWKSFLELHANRTLWKVENDDINEDIIYCELEFVIEQFKEITGKDVYLLGRSSRHVCVEDNEKNSKYYHYLRKIALQLEKEFIYSLNNFNKED